MGGAARVCVCVCVLRWRRPQRREVPRCGESRGAAKRAEARAAMREADQLQQEGGRKEGGREVVWLREKVVRRRGYG